MEWINCGERLPEDEQVVLCLFENQIFEGVIHVRYTNSTVFKMINEPFWYNIRATHWMPRPENPKIV